MWYGILLLRVVFGLTLAGHGAQKLFGWFGGRGPRGTGQFFEQLGFRAPVAMAVLAGSAEFAGGLAFTVGFLTPLAALGIAVVMLTAIATVKAPHGFWSQNGGYEFDLAVLTVVVAVTATGPGRFSIDRWVGWDGSISGLWWGVGVLAAALVISGLTVTLGRGRLHIHLRAPGHAA